MVYRWATTCFKCRITLSITYSGCPCPCLWSSSESEFPSPKFRHSGGFGASNSSVCGPGLNAYDKYGYYTVWLDLYWSLLCLWNKSNSRTSGLLVPSKPWDWGTKFCADHLPIQWEVSNIIFTTNMRGSTFIFVIHFKIKTDIITFFNERDKIMPLKFEGHCTTQEAEGIRMTDMMNI
jgi:hypothetical protein